MKEGKIISMNGEEETITIEVPVENHKGWRKYWIENDVVLVHIRKLEEN